MTDNAKLVADILGDWGWAEGEADYVEVQDEHIYIVGLDPGETTGLAILSINPNDPKELPTLIYLDQIEGGQDGFYDYFSQFYVGDNAIVVSEKWKERNKKGVNREPMYIEGVMHALWNRHAVNWQYPEMKSLVPDEWLKEQNLWTEGRRHQMDALIHAIVFLRNDGHEGTQGALGDGEGEGDGDGGEGGQTMAQPGDADKAQGNGAPMDEDARRELAELAREAAAKRIEENEKKEQGGGGGEASGDGTVEPKGKRKDRELDGAFFGFESKESMDGQGEVSLLDD